MTTYTLTGLAVYYPIIGDDAVGVENNVTLELVVPGSTTSMSYTKNPLPPGSDPGDQSVDVALDDYTVRINGMTIGEASGLDPDVSIFDVVWRDVSNILHTTTVLIPYLDNIDVTGLGVVDADYIFVIAGDPLPQINSAGDWDALELRLVNISVPIGVYGPGKDIALTSLGATVTENDTITGTDVRDVFNGGTGDDMITGLGGNDKLLGGGGTDVLLGGSGIDEMLGGNGADTLRGGFGNDQMLGGYGLDKLFGGKGNDVLKGGGGNDILKGEGGNDILKGDAGRDRLEGGDGKDVLLGGGGNDRMFGGKGNDKMNGGLGNDKMTGGAGADKFVFSKGKDVVTDFNTASAFEKVDLGNVGSITGFIDLKNNHVSENAGGHLVIADGSGNTLTLKGVSISDISGGDFIF